MLNLSDTLLAIDHNTSVALYLSSEGRPFLLHRHTFPGRCVLPSTHFGHALRHIQQCGATDLTMHLELRPAIAGLAPKVPFMAFVGVGEKVILAYVPAKLTVAEAEPIFGAFPDLPVLVCDAEEFFVSDQTWNRIVESKRPVESLTKVPLPSPTGPAVALPSPRRWKNPPKAHGRSHRC